jgi:hypothetical protein
MRSALLCWPKLGWPQRLVAQAHAPKLREDDLEDQELPQKGSDVAPA